MSTRILILKDGVITPVRTSTDSNAVVGSLGSSLVTSVNGTTGAVTLTKSSVDLNLVDNTADSTKVVASAAILTTARTINGISFNGSSNITINASDSTTRIASSEKGIANGVVPLNSSALIDSTYLPSYVDDILEFANLAGFPTTGESGKIYVAIDTNLTYRWTGSIYSNMSSSLALGITSTTAYRGDFGNTAYSHSQIVTGNPHGTTKSDIGLGSVDNTADSAKPVSTTQQTALNLKANLASPTFTGTVGGITATMVGLGSLVNSLQLVASSNLSDLANRQTALNTISGAVTSGTYLRGNGTNILLSTIQAEDIPTLNQNTTGTANNITGTVIIANGGTGATTQQAAINALVGNQTANRVLRSNGVNMLLAQVGLTTDVVDVLPIVNGGTGSSTQNFVDLTNTQTIGGAKTFSARIYVPDIFMGNPHSNVSTDIGKGYIAAGDWYEDFKVVSGGNIRYRCGAGAEFGYARQFMQVVASSGNIIFNSTAAATSTTAAAITGTSLGLTGDIYAGGIILPSLPTSSSGLPSGSLWRNGNVVNIV